MRRLAVGGVIAAPVIAGAATVVAQPGVATAAAAEPCTWENAGISTGAVVESDRVNPKTFYAYAAGKFSKSTDRGATFTTSSAAARTGGATTFGFLGSYTGTTSPVPAPITCTRVS